MANTEVKGKAITVARPAHLLYAGFSDMRNFVRNLPPDKQGEIRATEDTIEGSVKGFRLGIRIRERIPFSALVYEQFGESPFPFTIRVCLDAEDADHTVFHIEVSAELNFMLKMMLGSKLQEAVDRMTEQLGLAFEGKINPSDFNYGV